MTDPDEVQILIVEDNPEDLELILMALGRANCCRGIAVARDGVEALDFLFGGETVPPRPYPRMPRLILMDIKMPKVGGLELIARVKGDPRVCNIPLVALTSSAQKNDILESYRMGINSYVVKPVEFERFVEFLGRLSLYWLQLNVVPIEGGGH
jgi:two-component system response regulator